MKTIGLLGGMSWQSTVHYYQHINSEVNSTLGGLRSAKIVLNSVDFQYIAALQQEENWHDLGLVLALAAKSTEKAGADFLVICTNTMHKVIDEISQSISIPILHIADATAERLLADNVKRVGLLGTAFTMEQDFYRRRISEKFGIDVVTPNEKDRAFVHRAIYQELCQGIIKEDSRERYLRIIGKLAEDGCDGVVLGCTEISLLVKQGQTDVTLYDTTEIHAKAAVKMALRSANL